MPAKQSTAQQHPGLDAALAHLKTLSHCTVELTAIEAAIGANTETQDRLRRKRATITDVEEMREITRQQRIAECEAQDHLDAWDVLTNRRSALQAATPEVAEAFKADVNAMHAKLAEDYRRRYEQFLEQAVRPLVELGQALIAIGAVRMILSGINLVSADSRTDFVRNGEFPNAPAVLSSAHLSLNAPDGAKVTTSSVTVQAFPVSIEAKAAAEQLAPWSNASVQLQAIERELAAERFKADQAAQTSERLKNGPRFTSARSADFIPQPPPNGPWPKVQVTGKGVATMYPDHT